MTAEFFDQVTIDGASLRLTELTAIANGEAGLRVDEAALEAIELAHVRLVAARDNGAVYGANTGVGANRTVSVDGAAGPEGSDSHAKRLLRSHCAAVGEPEAAIVARATMVVRLNQIAAGHSGVSPRLAGALHAAITAGSLPTIHGRGPIGTADLSPLAELALTLAGELPWRSGGSPPARIADTDALPFISSSAMTLALSALGSGELRAVLDGAAVVASLSFLALQGSPQAYDQAVHGARTHPEQDDVAARMRSLIASGAAGAAAPARIQDPFGLRVVPQVHAPAVAALSRLATIVETELNAGVENPIVTDAGIFHHGQFHLATLAAAIDHVRISLVPVFALSSARLGMLLRPDMSGLPAFLAADAPGSSGMMVTEYLVQDLLAEMRMLATPTTGASVSISLGVEEHASFASQGARALWKMAQPSSAIVAVETVAAVRALRLAPERLAAAPVRDVFDFLTGELSPEITDRPLGEDIERAQRLVPLLAGLVGDSL